MAIDDSFEGFSSSLEVMLVSTPKSDHVIGSNIAAIAEAASRSSLEVMLVSTPKSDHVIGSNIAAIAEAAAWSPETEFHELYLSESAHRALAASALALVFVYGMILYLTQPTLVELALTVLSLASYLTWLYHRLAP